MSVGQKRPLKFDQCFYHGGCADGVCSAWVVDQYSTCEKFTPLFAGKDPIHDEKTNPFPIGKHIVYVDLCPSTNYLKKLITNKNQILILDHHDTSYRLLDEFLANRDLYPTLNMILDQKRSGCGICWEYFVDSMSVEYPWLLKHVEDRDLWKFQYAETKSIMAWVFYTYPNLRIQDIRDITQKTLKTLECQSKGEILLEIRQKDVDHYVGDAILCKFNDDLKIDQIGNILCVDCPRHLRSDVGEALAKREGIAFSAMWSYVHSSDEWWISLRSAEKSGVNVAKIAEIFGGGGHPNAAGFTWKKGSLMQVFTPINTPIQK